MSGVTDTRDHPFIRKGIPCTAAAVGSHQQVVSPFCRSGGIPGTIGFFHEKSQNPFPLLRCQFGRQLLLL